MIYGGGRLLPDIEGFRYQVYVAEQGKPLPQANHRDHRLPDEHDATAWHFVSSDQDGHIQACGRLHLGADIPTGQMLAMGLGHLDASRDASIGYVSKLMVDPEQRGSGLVMTLMRRMVEFGHSDPHGGEMAFFHCHPRLVELYERAGGRRFGRTFRDPHVGEQVPMFIMGGDIDHFTACRSPMRRIARSFAVPSYRKHQLLSLLDVGSGMAA